MKLYHYACSHSAAKIRVDRWLKPHTQPVLGGVELVWLTDLDVPNRAALGLTMTTIRCDRTRFRVTAVTSETVHWPVYAKRLPRHARGALEYAPGRLPMHWYVSELPVPVLEVTP